MLAGGFLAGGFSDTAIDTARTTERLSAFFSKQLMDEPVDNVFLKNPTLDELWQSRETGAYGRQCTFQVDTAASPNFIWFSDSDTFTTTIPDTVRTAVFAMKNAGDTVNIGWEELMEASKSDVRAYDVAKQRKNSTLKTIRDNLAAAVFNAAAPANQIFGLPEIVNTTSTRIGAIDRTANAYWQATVRTSVGAFASNGLTEMRTGWKTVEQEVGSDGLKFATTTLAVHNAFEAEMDPDVRYSDSSRLSRGAKNLMWHDVPVFHDRNVATGEMIFVDPEIVKFYVEESANFAFDPFREPINQKVATGKVLLRLVFIVTNPRGLLRLTGIT